MVKTSVALYFSGSRALMVVPLSLVELMFAFEFAIDIFALAFTFAFVFVAGWHEPRKRASKIEMKISKLQTAYSRLVLNIRHLCHDASRRLELINGGGLSLQHTTPQLELGNCAVLSRNAFGPLTRQVRDLPASWLTAASLIMALPR